LAACRHHKRPVAVAAPLSPAAAVAAAAFTTTGFDVLQDLLRPLVQCGKRQAVTSVPDSLDFVHGSAEIAIIVDLTGTGEAGSEMEVPKQPGMLPLCFILVVLVTDALPPPFSVHCFSE